MRLLLNAPDARLTTLQIHQPEENIELVPNYRDDHDTDYGESDRLLLMEYVC